MLGIAAGQCGHHHRHEPQRDRQQEARPAQPPTARALRRRHAQALPAAPAHQRVGNQRQQRQETHALADHAQAGGEATQPVPAPVRTEQQMAAQAVHAQGDEEHHGRIDLRALALVDELHRAQHRAGRPQRGLAVPGTAREIVGQRQRAQRRQQRGNQEGDVPVAHHRVGGRDQPEVQRRLVRIQLLAAVREQPLARLPHLPGHQHEARLVGRPRRTHAQPRADHHQREQQEPPERSLVVGLDHGAR